MTVQPSADSPDDVLAFLVRRKCAKCRGTLDSVRRTDISLSRYSPRWRCYPPHPTTWEFHCPTCHQEIMVHVRKGKVWVREPLMVTRKSPQRRGATQWKCKGVREV